MANDNKNEGKYTMGDGGQKATRFSHDPSAEMRVGPGRVGQASPGGRGPGRHSKVPRFDPRAGNMAENAWAIGQVSSAPNPPEAKEILIRRFYLAKNWDKNLGDVRKDRKKLGISLPNERNITHTHTHKHIWHSFVESIISSHFWSLLIPLRYFHIVLKLFQ